MKKAVCLFLFLFTVFNINISAFAYDSTEENLVVQGLGAYDVTENSLLLKWDAVKDAYGYKIYIQKKSGAKYEFYSESFEPYCEVNDLKRATVYRFKVSVLFENSGQAKEGKKSEALAALTAPGKVPSVITEETGTDYITVSWEKAKGAQFYEVWFYSEEKEDFTLLAVTEETFYKKDGLKNDCIYSFRIRPICSKEEIVTYGEYAYHYDFTYTESLPYTNSQAAKYYNDGVNKAKEEKDFKLTVKKTAETETLSCSKYSLLKTVKNMMNLFAGSVKKTYTFSNGKSGNDTPTSIIEPLKKNASLKGDYIKFFEMTENDGNLTLKIKLKNEEATFTNKKTNEALYHSSVMKKINISGLKTSPLEIVKGTQAFDGADITATFKEGSLTKLQLKNTAKVNADLKVSSVDFNTDVCYTVNTVYTFKYQK